MVQQAPTPSDISSIETFNPKATVSVIGCGGCGINLSRHFAPDTRILHMKFDTSMANARPGEKVYVLGDGSGSGSLRSENAKEIDKAITTLSDQDLCLSDVGIFVFSLCGGTGSVIAPLMMREYARKGKKVIGVAVADTSHAVGANNTSNTLKTLMAVAKNNNIVMPLILVSNDNADSNRDVDDIVVSALQHLLDLLLLDVREIDRNDRLNWVDSSKVTGTAPGLKMMKFMSEKMNNDPKIILGSQSDEMVDSLLVIQDRQDESAKNFKLPYSRLKKTGVYEEKGVFLAGSVSSDISDINTILDAVERMQNQTRAQVHSGIDRLESNISSSSNDLIL